MALSCWRYRDGAGWSGSPSKNAGQGPSLRAVSDVMVPSSPSIVKTPQLNVAPRPNCGTISPETATIQTAALSSAAAGLDAPGSPLARYSRHVISLASIRSIRRTSAVSLITALVASGCWILTARIGRRGVAIGATYPVGGWFGSLSNEEGHPSEIPASLTANIRPGTASTRKIPQRYGGYGVGLPGSGWPNEIGSRRFGQTSPATATAQT